LNISVSGISVTVTVGRFGLFPLMGISVTITVNLNHSELISVWYQKVKCQN